MASVNKRQPHNKLNLVNKKYGRLLVLREVELKQFPCGDRKTQYLCLCECGQTITVLGSSLTTGNTSSCGCVGRYKTVLRNFKHGMQGTRTYRIWQAMLNRCRNENVPNYRDYGGRGIRVCGRWTNFECFLSDMGEAPKNKSIDRINNNGDYTPENCKWSTRKEQSRNTRANKVIQFNGERKILTDWAKHLNMDQSSLSERIDNWGIERALTTPKMR